MANRNGSQKCTAFFALVSIVIAQSASSEMTAEKYLEGLQAVQEPERIIGINCYGSDGEYGDVVKPTVVTVRQRPGSGWDGRKFIEDSHHHDATLNSSVDVMLPGLVYNGFSLDDPELEAEVVFDIKLYQELPESVVGATLDRTVQNISSSNLEPISFIADLQFWVSAFRFWLRDIDGPAQFHVRDLFGSGFYLPYDGSVDPIIQGSETDNWLYEAAEVYWMHCEETFLIDPNAQ